MSTNPLFQAITEKVQRALKAGSSIIVACRVEGGQVHCDCDVLNFPTADIDLAKDLILVALDDHKAKQTHVLPVEAPRRKRKK